MTIGNFQSFRQGETPHHASEAELRTSCEPFAELWIECDECSHFCACKNPLSLTFTVVPRFPSSRPTLQDPRTIVVRSPRSKSSWWRGLVDFERERLVVLKNTLRTIAPEAVHTIPTIYPDEVHPVLASLDLHR